MAGRSLAYPVDPHMAGLDQRGGAGTGFDQTRMPQPFVETLALHTAPKSGLILAARGHLLLERGEFGERRIRIGGTIALARVRARRILPMRRAAFPAPVTVASTAVTPLVASTFTGCIVAVARLAAIAVVVAALALEALTRPAVLVLALVRTTFACRRAIGSNTAGGGLIGPGFAKIAVTVAPPMMLAALALAAFAGNRFTACRSRGCAFRRTFVTAMMSLAIMARRTALVGAAAGTPDLDQFGLSRRGGCSFR